MQDKGTPDLPACIVRTGRELHIGMLYFQNDRVVVLLNNLLMGVDLGLPKPIYNKYAEHEADILVFPKSTVDKVQILGVALE